MKLINTKYKHHNSAVKAEEGKKELNMSYGILNEDIGPNKCGYSPGI